MVKESGPHKIESWQARNLAKQIIKEKNITKEFTQKAIYKSLGLPTKK